MNKKLFLSLLIAGGVFTTPMLAKRNPKKSSFLVDKTPRTSKNEIKEDIGEEIKSALHSCVAISNELGKLQQQIACMQKQLLSNVENLIDNKKPFKKAKRKTLINTRKIMGGVAKDLQIQKTEVVKMMASMEKSPCLKAGKA